MSRREARISQQPLDFFAPLWKESSSLRVLGLARGAEQLLARRGQRDASRIGGVAAVARAAAFKRDGGAYLQQVPRPPETEETRRAAEFPCPVHRLAGVVH